MTKDIQVRSAGGLLFRDDHVLLIHWDPPRDSYDFPKGTIDKGETVEDACVREVLEETGYATRIIDFIGRTHYEFDGHDGRHIKKAVDYYLLESTEQTNVEPRRETHETFHNTWVPVNDAANVITRDIDKEIFRKALALRQSIQL